MLRRADWDSAPVPFSMLFYQPKPVGGKPIRTGIRRILWAKATGLHLPYLSTLQAVEQAAAIRVTLYPNHDGNRTPASRLRRTPWTWTRTRGHKTSTTKRMTSPSIKLQLPFEHCKVRYFGNLVLSPKDISQGYFPRIPPKVISQGGGRP